jgi:hypothetical protein
MKFFCHFHGVKVDALRTAAAGTGSKNSAALLALLLSNVVMKRLIVPFIASIAWGICILPYQFC